HVLARLIPVDQFLQWAGQILIGVDDRHELTDIEPALEGEIAADGVEQERRHLGQEIVDELDQEFPLIENVQDLEDQSETRRDIGPSEMRSGVAVYRTDAVDDFADAPRKLARSQLPLPAEIEEAPAHARDDDSLNRDDRRGDHAEPEILHDDENEGGDR